jgi:hypothetical protein
LTSFIAVIPVQLVHSSGRPAGRGARARRAGVLQPRWSRVDHDQRPVLRGRGRFACPWGARRGGEGRLPDRVDGQRLDWRHARRAPALADSSKACRCRLAGAKRRARASRSDDR